MVAVIEKLNGSYSWFKYSEGDAIKYHMNKVQDIIATNHFNFNPEKKQMEGMIG